MGFCLLYHIFNNLFENPPSVVDGNCIDGIGLLNDVDDSLPNNKGSAGNPGIISPGIVVVNVFTSTLLLSETVLKYVFKPAPGNKPPSIIPLIGDVGSKPNKFK